jgi:hypothetical protein
MTQQEAYNLLKEDSSVFSIIELPGEGHRLVLQDGIGWVDLFETETILWDDIEVFFNETIDHTSMDEEQFMDAYNKALSNLYEANEQQDEEEEEEEEE